MWLEIGILSTKVARASDGERAWLIDYLTFKDKSAYFKGRSSDDVCMYNVPRGTFPTGLLALVEGAAPEAEITIERVDRRKAPCVRDESADLAWLYDYQVAAVGAVCKQARGILWIPTGGGKTEVFAGLTKALPCKWLFLVSRETLMANAADRYEKRTGLVAGRIGGGKWEVPDDARAVCATFQTIYRGIQAGDERIDDLVRSAEGLAVDECHQLPANTFYKTAMAAQSAYFRVGFSGTPLARGDERTTYAIAALGPVIHRVKTELLVERGVLARATIHVPRCRQRSERPTWQGVYGESIVNGATRNRILVEACKRATKPCLLFVKEIKHGKMLEKALWKEGLSTKFVYGNAGLDQRQRAKKDLVRGAYDVLICSVIFQEGEDIPDLRSVIVGSAGRSVIASLQRIGRGMRVAKGKTEFEVYDVADLGCACMGGPTSMRHAGCKWLDKHTRERLKAYVGEGHTTRLEDWGVLSAPTPLRDVL